MSRRADKSRGLRAYTQGITRTHAPPFSDCLVCLVFCFLGPRATVWNRLIGPTVYFYMDSCSTRTLGGALLTAALSTGLAAQGQFQ